MSSLAHGPSLRGATARCRRSWRQRWCTRRQPGWKRSSSSGGRRRRRREGWLRGESAPSLCTAPDPPGQHLLQLPSNSFGDLASSVGLSIEACHQPCGTRFLQRGTSSWIHLPVQCLPSLCYTFADGPLCMLHAYTSPGAPLRSCAMSKEERLTNGPIDRPPALHHPATSKSIEHLQEEREDSEVVGIAANAARQQDEQCNSISTYGTWIHGDNAAADSALSLAVIALSQGDLQRSHGIIIVASQVSLIASHPSFASSATAGRVIDQLSKQGVDRIHGGGNDFDPTGCDLPLCNGALRGSG